MMKLILMSEGHGDWGFGIIQHLCDLIGAEMVFDNNNASVIARSAFFPLQKEQSSIDLPYFTWTGESYVVTPRSQQPPLFELVSRLPENCRQVHVPYLVCVYFQMQIHFNKKFDMLNLRICRNDWKIRPYFAAYCASNNKCAVRERLFQLLREKDKTNTAHGLGECQATPGRRAAGHWDTVWQSYTNYRFTVAMENSQVDGYVTEKLLNAIISGSIPIYWGDSKWVKQVFNEKSIIFVDDFASLDECADYVVHVDQTPDLLEQYYLQVPFVKEVEWFSVDTAKPEYLKAANMLKNYCVKL